MRCAPVSSGARSDPGRSGRSGLDRRSAKAGGTGGAGGGGEGHGGIGADSPGAMRLGGSKRVGVPRAGPGPPPAVAPTVPGPSVRSAAERCSSGGVERRRGSGRMGQWAVAVGAGPPGGASGALRGGHGRAGLATGTRDWRGLALGTGVEAGGRRCGRLLDGPESLPGPAAGSGFDAAEPESVAPALLVLPMERSALRRGGLTVDTERDGD